MRETYQMQIMDSMIPNAEKTPDTHFKINHWLRHPENSSFYQEFLEEVLGFRSNLNN
jgi:hypothetical protein